MFRVGHQWTKLLDKLIADVQEELNRSKKEYDHLYKLPDYHLPIHRDYLLTISELEAVIKACETFDKTMSGNAIIEYLMQFLHKRASRIDESDAARWINFKSPANRLHDNISKLLKAARDSIYKTSNKLTSLEIALPQLKAKKSPYHGQDYGDVNPWAWILGEDGFPIEIEHCLNYFKKNGFYRSTHPDANGIYRPLSKTEIDLIIHHSHELKYFLISSKELSIQQFEERLVKVLKNPNYEINATYGPDGDKRLNVKIFNDFITQFQNLRTWSLLLITTELDLIKSFIPLGNKKIDEVTIEDIYTPDEVTYRVKMLFLAEIYRRELTERTENHTGIVLFGYGFGCVKDDKLEAVKIFQAFLVTKLPLSQFKSWLQQEGHEKYIPILFDNKSLVRKSKLYHLVLLAIEYQPQPACTDNHIFDKSEELKKAFSSRRSRENIVFQPTLSDKTEEYHREWPSIKRW